ncbi:MAG: 50S ribosomal protein L22 [Candidatus Levyibacteriota bacterium]
MKTFVAESKNVKVSPRKMRLVVDGIKMLPVERAVAALTVANKRAAGPIKKVLESAIANAVHNGKVEKKDLFISQMFVNEGIAYKRYHFAARGRIRPYKKRTSHVKVILGAKDAVLPVKAEAKVAEKKVEKEVMKKETIKKGKEATSKK